MRAFRRLGVARCTVVNYAVVVEEIAQGKQRRDTDLIRVLQVVVPETENELENLRVVFSSSVLVNVLLLQARTA